MMAEITIGNCRLFHGDCQEIFPALDPVDHVIADPPYEEHMHAAKRGRKVKGAQRRIRTDGHANPPAIDFASIDDIRSVATRECIRLSHGWVMFFCTPEGVALWRDMIEVHGGRYKRACIWIKPDSAPQFNGQGPAMGAEMFVTAWAGTGYSRWNGGGRRNVFTHPCQPPDRTGLHPTEKPLALMGEIIRLFTDPSDTILDPFMGIASTGVACLKLGRKFIGIERDKKYFDIAVKRIEDAHAQGDLFVPPPPKSVQTSFEI
jgi:site-specific DNA-methyltransferase (adenine-specific)